MSFLFFLITIVLVSSVHGKKCVEQIFPSYKMFDISVTTDVVDGEIIDIYFVCNHKSINTLGYVTCNFKNGCRVPNVLRMKPQIVEKLYILYIIGYLVDQYWICVKKQNVTKGLINLNNATVAYNRGFYFAPHAIYIWENFKLIYRGEVGKLIQKDGTESIYFSYNNSNFTIDLSYEVTSHLPPFGKVWRDQKIRAGVSYSNMSFIDNLLLDHIIKRDTYVPNCNTVYVCGKTLPDISSDKWPFYISLFFNVLLLTILGSSLSYIWQSWKKKSSEVVHTEVNLAEYAVFVNKKNYRKKEGEKIISHVESADSDRARTEYLEYYSVYSDIPKVYAVRIKT